MTTERMTELDKALGSLGFTHDVSAARNELATLRRVEQEQAEKIRKLEDMLRLANDKMDAQARQARWEVADEALYLADERSIRRALERIRDANAPKD